MRSSNISLKTEGSRLASFSYTQWAIDEVVGIKEDGNHITAMLSVADLIQLGGYCAVEYCGGPVINFR